MSKSVSKASSPGKGFSFSLSQFTFLEAAGWSWSRGYGIGWPLVATGHKQIVIFTVCAATGRAKANEGWCGGCTNQKRSGAKREENEPRKQSIHCVLFPCGFSGMVPISKWEKGNIMSDFLKSARELSRLWRWTVRHGKLPSLTCCQKTLFEMTILCFAVNCCFQNNISIDTSLPLAKRITG